MAIEKLSFQRVDWSPKVAAGLQIACGWAFEAIRDEVKKGVAECWEIAGFGYVVSRFEVEPEKVIVMVAGQGRGMLQVLEAFENIGRRNGCQQIRIHSRRVGMIRFLKSKKYKVERGLGEVIFYGRL